MKLAPSYTIILMGLFAEKFILPLLTNVSGFYLCFMEDIFLVGSELKLNLTNFSKKLVDVILTSNLHITCKKQKTNC